MIILDQKVTVFALPQTTGQPLTDTKIKMLTTLMGEWESIYVLCWRGDCQK